MKKINLKGISEILSEKELKNVMGGSSGGSDCSYRCDCTLASGFPGLMVSGQCSQAACT